MRDPERRAILCVSGNLARGSGACDVDLNNLSAAEGTEPSKPAEAPRRQWLCEQLVVRAYPQIFAFPPIVD